MNNFQPLSLLTPEEIENNFLKFRMFCEKLHDRSEPVLKMVDELSERLATCPASGKKEYHRAEPGGLVDHSLRVLGNALRITNAFGWKIPKSSLIISALFHDLGKIGDVETDYYIEQNDQWRRDKLGEMYTYNKNLQYMEIPDRSLYLLQHYGIKLNVDEMIAIKIHDGYVIDGNKPYCMKDPILATVISMSDIIAAKQEKGEVE